MTSGWLDESHRFAVLFISYLVIYPVSVYQFFDFEYTKSEAAFALRITTAHVLGVLGALAYFLYVYLEHYPNM